MKETNEKINGDFPINEDLVMFGMITGNANVLRGVTFILHGMVCKDLIIEANGIVEIHGMVNGDVINNGGKLSVYGMIIGSLIKNGGETLIDPNAVIKNKKKS